MKEDRLRHVWDEVRMSREQEERIWNGAKQKVQGCCEKKKNPGAAWAVGVLAVAVLVCALIVPEILKMKRTGTAAEEQDNHKDTVQVLTQEELESYENYLVCRYADRAQDGSCDADAAIIVSLNRKKQETKLLYIPQSLYLVENKEGEAAVAAVMDFAWEDMEQVKEQLGGQLNLAIDGYILADQELFVELVDSLLAIELEVTSDELYSHELCREIAELIYTRGEYTEMVQESGRVLMNGAQALAWGNVCGNTIEGGQYGERQLCLLTTLLDRLKLDETEWIGWLRYRMQQRSLVTDKTAQEAADFILAVQNSQVTYQYSLLRSEYLDTLPQEENGTEYGYERKYIADWEGWLREISVRLYGGVKGDEAQRAKVLKEEFEQCMNRE